MRHEHCLAVSKSRLKELFNTVTDLIVYRGSRSSRYRQWVGYLLTSPAVSGIHDRALRAIYNLNGFDQPSQNFLLERKLTFLSSSGMCKAGFAGDDAPRAVFRKSTLLISQLYKS